ncbi:MAG: hypothetical protein WAW63_00630 [Candidatus Saccharimonadales bacterium]|nr:hypothetical protein [Candidatus Saccharibacteria bacterium]
MTETPKGSQIPSIKGDPERYPGAHTGAHGDPVKLIDVAEKVVRVIEANVPKAVDTVEMTTERARRIILAFQDGKNVDTGVLDDARRYMHRQVSDE